MYIILLPILFPILMGAILPLIPWKNRRVRNLYVEMITALTSAFAFYVMFHRPSMDFVALKLAGELEIMFHIDGLGMVFAALVAFLWPFATIYAFEYMEHSQKDNVFFCFYIMTFGVTLGIAFAGNLMTMYMFYEMLTLVTMPLVMHGMDHKAIRAGQKYMAYSIGGAAFAFIGFIFVYRLGDTMDFSFGGVFSDSVIAASGNLLRFVYVLAVLGFGVKSAIFPFHGWLPSASVAPTPVTALLHAVAVVKAGAFAIMRITYYSFGPDMLKGTFAQYVFLAFAIITILYGSIRAVREPHLKRRLAYSTVSNLSYILFGVALMTPLGLVGGLTHMIAHAFIKITLFYCAGAILHKTGKEYVRDMTGIAQSMPFTIVCFLVSGMGLIGIPPFIGFLSKWNLCTAAVEEGSIGAIIGCIVLLVSALLTAVYIFRFVITAYHNPKAEKGNPKEKTEPSLRMMIPMGLFSVMVLLLAMYAKPLIAFFELVANGLI